MDFLFDSHGNLRDISEENDISYELTDSNLNILETGAKNIQTLNGSKDDSIHNLLRKKIRISKKAKLIDLYPKMKPIEPKPFFYDIAVDEIEYPNLDKTIKELQDKSTQGGGIFSKLKFWG